VIKQRDLVAPTIPSGLRLTSEQFKIWRRHKPLDTLAYAVGLAAVLSSLLDHETFHARLHGEKIAFALDHRNVSFGQNRKGRVEHLLSAIPPKADFARSLRDVSLCQFLPHAPAAKSACLLSPEHREIGHRPADWGVIPFQRA
jgi:hypothetical protein